MRKHFIIAMLCVAAACASGGSSTESNGPARNPDVISAEELSLPEIASGDLLQAVQRLRPRFLVTRGAASTSNSSAGTTHVSVDGAPLQSVDFLKNLRPFSIKEIRYLSPTDASQKYGTSAGMGGVILVVSK